MQLFPSRMVDEVASNLRDTANRSASVQEIGTELNRAMRNLVAKIRENNSDFFRKSTTIAVVAGVAEYDLPLDCPPNGVLSVEPYIDGVDVSKRFIPFDTRGLHVGADSINFTMRHDGRRGKLNIVPTPDTAQTVTVWYTQESPEMQYGTPGAINGSTITLPASPTMGRRQIESYGLVGARIELTAGSAMGDVRTVTGYVPSTRVATVDSPWTLVPSASTTTFEVLPGWVDDHCADVLVLDSLIRLDKRNHGDGGDWKDLYGEKLAVVLRMTKTLQRAQPEVIPLGRGLVRPRIPLRPGQRR